MLVLFVIGLKLYVSQFMGSGAARRMFYIIRQDHWWEVIGGFIKMY